MKKRTYPKITVSTKAQSVLADGHPWIYDTEIKAIDNENQPVINGSLVDVAGEKDNYIGTGIYSEKSKIRIRLVSSNANDRFDSLFFERRIKYAWDYRKAVMGDDVGACRIIFGEADKFPGLTVDRFGDVLVTQTLSIGMEKLKDIIFPLIYKVLTEDGQKIRGIFERNDVAIRELEGLEQNKGWYPLNEKISDAPENSGSTHVLIKENGLEYEVDIENGQKTGYFLDQKYNRSAIAKIAKGKRVLDCFTHTGSFALNAALGGAEHITAVDISAEAVQLAQRNAERNNLCENIDFKCANVFDLLHDIEKEGVSNYDLIILDPPAFTKSRRTVESATRGYKEINYRAMKILPRGGYLATCSCSHFMENNMFVKMLRSAAKDALVELRQVEMRQQSPDHPIVWGIPETDYLKFYIFQIV